MEANAEIVVLYANNLHMEKDASEGGGFIDGVSVSYLYGHDMVPVQHPDGSLGQRAAKGFLSPEAWGDFGPVPAIYDGIFDVVVDSKGKPTFKLKSVKYRQCFDIVLLDKDAPWPVPGVVAEVPTEPPVAADGGKRGGKA